MLGAEKSFQTKSTKLHLKDRLDTPLSHVRILLYLKKVIGLVQTGLEDQACIGRLLIELSGYVEQTSGFGCHQDG